MRFFLISLISAIGFIANSFGATDNLKISSHLINVNGKELKYTATVGTLPIKNEGAKDSSVNIFFVSYSLETDSLQSRPITFIFNGGPGSSSIWLHLGAFGPKKISFKDELCACSSSYELSENQQTLLQYSDLVFIDPVGTGFSQISSTDDLDDYYSLDKDAKVIGDFICKYITVFDKWLSKKFISGESYGTIRAVCTTEYLQDDLGIFLDGISLISPVINASHLCDDSEQIFALRLPTYAATAWFHKQLPPSLQDKTLSELLQEVKSFAVNEYALSLFFGDLLLDSKKEEVATALSQYTGISKEILIKNNLKLDIFTFAKSLLPKDNSTDLDFIIGPHDTRFKGYCKSGFDIDENPSFTSISGIYCSVANNYFRNELGYTSDEPYVMLNKNANRKWNWEKDGQRDFNNVDISSNMRHIIMANPKLKIFVASGYYDLATPFAAAEYDINHLHLPAKLRGQIEFHAYESGHMIYLNEKSHQRLTKDLISIYLDSSRIDGETGACGASAGTF